MTHLFELQNFLFEANPGRNELSEYIPKSAADHKIVVYRNHSFELIEKTIRPYLDFAGIGAEFIYSDYDDSLSFLNFDTTADLLILWLDVTRYEIDDVKKFIQTRLNALEETYKKNVLFLPFGGELRLEGAVNYSFDPFVKKLGNRFTDMRMEKFSGTKLSLAASMEIARDLGLNFIPALLRPGLKGIVVDLDNTLYKGVLGEDGVYGVELTEGHRDLQTHLKVLSQQGFFLCVASKNDENDVLALFEQRQDFPLRLSDFTKIHANWESKANSISSVAKFLNIHSNSLLFIDDNLGEIVSVLQAHPDIQTIWAKENARITVDVLRNFPGTLKLSLKAEDGLRKQDAIANETRQKMQSALSKEDYIKSLKVELDFTINEPSHIERIAELANKTNQFIYTYRRYSVAEVEAFMRGPGSCIVTISMKDSLSNSGIIGAVMLKIVDGVVRLDECFVSCRALGRGFDDAIVLGAILEGLRFLGTDKFEIQFIEGERNLPARKFKDESMSKFASRNAGERYKIPSDLLKVTVTEGKPLGR